MRSDAAICAFGMIESTSVVTPAGTLDNTRRMVEGGRHTFRSDPCGREAFWGDTLQLHRAYTARPLALVN